MLILKYFVTVGLALTLGLFALSAHLESEKATSGLRVHTTASLAIVPPPKQEVVEAVLPETILPPEVTKPSRSRHSGHRERRSR
jgi:hypothetical protein